MSPPVRALAKSVESVSLSSGALPLQIVRSERAKRYVIKLSRDSTVKLTIPRGGSLERGRAFLQANMEWLSRASARLATRPRLPRVWQAGTEIVWRGERVILRRSACGEAVLFGSESLCVASSTLDLRPAMEEYMRAIAVRELPGVVLHFAREHQLGGLVRRVSVRNQRSRWGSCSRTGTISLNWRLVLTPLFVRDYLVLHELMHLRQMNHSVRFWNEVASVCPEYQDAERWLNQHAFLLM